MRDAIMYWGEIHSLIKVLTTAGSGLVGVKPQRQE